MDSIVEIQVSGEKIILRVPHKNIVDEIDNVASFDLRTKKLVSTGICREKFQENYPKKWNRYKNHLEFRPVFDMAPFDPETAAMFLLGWWDEMMGRAAGNLIVFRAQAKLQISLCFDHYAEIPLNKQQDFEYLIFRYLHAKKLIINGCEKQQNRRNTPPIWLLLILNYVFIVGFTLFSIIPVSMLTTIIAATEMSAWLNFLLFTLTLFGALCLFAIAGDFVSKLLWMLCMKPFFSNETLVRALEYQINLPQKHRPNKYTNWLMKWLLLEHE